MLIPDVNVFVYAHRGDTDDHAGAKLWLEDALGGDEEVGVSEFVLAAFVRIVTNFRVFTLPSTLDQAFEFCAAVVGAPSATKLAPGPNHWQHFAQLCQLVNARANTIPDAYLAALATERRATFVTRDRGFARFPGLRVLDPMNAPTA